MTSTVCNFDDFSKRIEMSSSKRLQERLRREEQETAHVFQDFIETFQNVQVAQTKAFVRSGILYSKDNDAEKSGQMYNPKPFIKTTKSNDINSARECATILKPANLERSKKVEKQKSNLEQLKDELKQRHSEKGERARRKEDLEQSATCANYLETGDPNSTNLFITNLNSKVTESHLLTEFGAYGPLASVKIMWPRGDEKFRISNCGFVAFMSRNDAERALKENKHRVDIRIGWGKSVEIPPHPIYIPDELLKLYLPPPLTGLPFNAQPPYPQWSVPADDKEFEDFLKACYVKVTVPLNKKIIMIIHRMVEFVVREGPMFEAFIMNKEIKNPDFTFLFDCQSPLHIYYRWKIYSILNGDAQKSWSMKPFRMFKHGSIWLPPVAPNYTEGMPDELFKDTRNSKKLSEGQIKRLISLIRNLTMNRAKISEAMVFCLNHKDALDDSLDIILESLVNSNTSPLHKVARLYLLSDVLTNAKSKRISVNLIEDNSKLIRVLNIMRNDCDLLKFESDRSSYMQRILKVINHWDICAVFTQSTIKEFEDIFPKEKTDLDEDTSSIDEPLDGANLLRRSLESDVGPEVITSLNFGDKDKENRKVEDEKLMAQYFIPSKWDTVDPEEVEAQAVSTEEIYYMEKEKQKESKRYKKNSIKKKNKHR